MLVCITDQRILIWKHSPWHLPRKFLGSVERARVRATQLERSSHVNWNVITIELDEGQQIRFLIDQSTAVHFAKTLDASSHEQNIDPEITPT
jgi:hypothetical protein